MSEGKFSLIIAFLFICNLCFSQNVPILSYSQNSYGQVQLEIDAKADQYYILTALHAPNLTLESHTSITMGIDGLMYISEPLEAFPLQNYKITAYPIANPNDTDGDGIDDITEFNNMPTQAPLNFAETIPFIDGATSIDSRETFSALAVVNDDIPWAPFLNNQEFAKFAIVSQDSDNPRVFFINSNTHYIHADFLNTINTFGQEIVTGEIVYNPNEILPNGAIGSYSFNFSFGDSYPFDHTRKTFELLAASMPFLENNFQHFIGNGGESMYENTFKDDYIGSRINVVLESEFFADIDFLPFNQAEGYGFFRKMQLDENPGSRDIVLYDALPNSLPRVGGIITSVVQTPLSHVNLRAIQDNVPNAYIKNPEEIDSIANLLGKYIYYKVDQDKYEVREASLEEVNAWYENIRPTEDQIPDRDLSQTNILPLDDIKFDMANAFGAKCSNVATMRTFGFPDGTIPDGYGIPFYYYDEFMKFNGFYEKVEEMITDTDFITDLETRIDKLKDFRKDIKNADMPQWMLDDLQAMHDAFPEGTSVRCRSSTNNEDLPGFSGAGLYTSKTQHPEEGHISKSVKQVYASMWNFRAFDERDFYRVDHYIAAMGLLCHPNFEDEKSNGVGVSIDPIFNTENTFYLNTQVGEFLITNPDANSIPEEILLNQDPNEGYFVLRNSNLVPDGQLVMGEEYLDLMRTYLKVIHDEFAVLYNVVGAEGYGMDIEYKVTKEDQLIIKQARPWVSFWSEIKSNFDLSVIEITDPKSSSTLSEMELITAKIRNVGLKEMKDFEISLQVDGLMIETIAISDELDPQNFAEYQFTIPQDFSEIKDYEIEVSVSHPSDGYSKNDTLNTVISQLHLLEGGISSRLERIKCGSEIDLVASVANYGEESFYNTEIEVVVNGLVVEVINYDFTIPYSTEVDIPITITENLTQTDNEIILNLVSVNGQSDAISDNNSSSLNTDLNSNFDFITLIINADDYPQETSWQIYDEITNELVGSGFLSANDDVVTENICVNYSSCFRLYLFDEIGDGICCAWGEGNFSVLNQVGESLIFNNGVFNDVTEELFCPNGEGCILEAEITKTDASNNTATDGRITINTTNGIAPFQYSIDGGQNFTNNPVFFNLAPGIYNTVVKDATNNCILEESIEIGFDITIDVNDIPLGSIQLYPNPTHGNFVIEIDNNFSTSDNVKIEIYNNLGILLESESILKFNSESKAEISLGKYPAGNYIARCYNQDFEKHFNVIKI